MNDVIIENDDIITTHKAVVFTRVSSAYDGLAPREQFAGGFGDWVLSIDRAREQQFLLMWKDGVLADAGTVYAADQIPSRYTDKPSPRVVFAVGHAIPGWLEKALGAPLHRVHRNPVMYVTIERNVTRGTVSIFRTDGERILHTEA